MTIAATNQIYSYKFKADWPFKIGLSILIILTIAMLSFTGKDVFQLSSYIIHPQNFLLPLNEWGIDCESQDARALHTKYYLILDTFFPVFLSFIVVLLLRGATFSYEEEGTNKRIFDFSLFPNRIDIAAKVAIVFLSIAMCLDWYENSMVYNALVDPPYGDINASNYALIGSLKMLGYLVPLALMLGSFVYTYLLDFGTYLKKYVTYFYPTIIGVALTFLIFGFFGQAFDFIVELAEPINLAIFLVLFTFALIGLWMVPYYLYYTRTLGFKDLGFKEIVKYTIKPYFANSKTSDIKALERNAINKRYKKFRHSEEEYFHKIRRSLAITFIITFLMIQLNLIAELMNISSSIVSLVVIINLLGIIVISIKYRKARNSDIAAIDNNEKSDILTGKLLNKNSKLFDLSTWLFVVLILNMIAVSVHFIYSFIMGADLLWILIIYCTHTFLFSWAFLIYALYRKVELCKGDFKFKVNRVIYTALRRVSYTPVLIKYYFIFSLAAFVIAVLLVCSDSYIIELLNPLNLFLIVLNFFVALIAFLDRVIYASLRSGKIKLGKNSGGIILFSVLIFLYAINTVENHYHDLERKAFVETSDLNYMNLESYTENFINTHNDSVVYFIAADGGGLKAAYWTMNVLQKLNETNSSFFNHVFLTTGASGGMVGLGMYTFMHGQGLNMKDRSQKIKKLGSTNFLNNDLAGLAIKSPAVYLFPPLANVIIDRTEDMSRRYFQLTAENQPVFESILNKPFGYLWQQNNYTNLPLLVVNTTKAEDGSRGIIHPLLIDEDDDMIGSMTDLTDYYFKNGQLDSVVSLNLPDGLFTTNRFPALSPFARIEGKGHFVDGGYLENSGLSTVYHFLNYMQLKADTSNIYGDFFKKKIVVISIGNERSAFIRQSVSDPKINKSGSTGEIAAILGAISGGGLSALPQYYDNLFKALESAEGTSSIDLKFVQVDMPFPFTTGNINSVFQGQVVNCDLNRLAKEKRDEIVEYVSGKPCSICPGQKPYFLTPPLGRFMSRPSRDYMTDMINHPAVSIPLDTIISYLE